MANNDNAIVMTDPRTGPKIELIATTAIGVLALPNPAAWARVLDDLAAAGASAKVQAALRPHVWSLRSTLRTVIAAHARLTKDEILRQALQIAATMLPGDG